MKHKTGFALCLAVIVLTGMVTAAVGLLFTKQQDVAALRRRIAALTDENQTLRARLEPPALAEQAQAGEGGSAARP